MFLFNPIGKTRCVVLLETDLLDQSNLDTEVLLFQNILLARLIRSDQLSLFFYSTYNFSVDNKKPT